MQGATLAPRDTQSGARMTPRTEASPRDGRQDGLDVEGLRKSYRNKPVIRDVSLRLARGEVVALLGPNGSGKTTSVSYTHLTLPTNREV